MHYINEMIRTPRQPRIVTLAPSLWRITGYEICQSILEHVERGGHWQFAGIDNSPWFPENDVPWSQIDGIIGKFGDDKAAVKAERHGVAIVNLSAEEQGLPYALVGTDDAVVGRMGADHLIKCGFPAYAFFGIAPSWRSRKTREAFQHALEEAGRTCHVYEDAEPYRHEPQELIQAWLTALPKPIAIMAHNDWLARHTITAALQLDLKVPGDVAVLGVNNYIRHNILSPVPISSVQPDHARIGLLAAQLLDRLMDGEPVPPPIFVPPIGVKARQSTDIIATDDPVVTTAMQFIQKNATRGINVEDVAGTVDVTRKTLNKRLQRAVGMSTHALITESRINAAKTLLSTTHFSIEEIARLTGYPQQKRLNEAFKRVTNLTPTEFRQQHPPV